MLEQLVADKKWATQVGCFCEKYDGDFMPYDKLGEPEDDFFDVVARHKELIPLIEKYIKHVDCPNGSTTRGYP